MVDAIAGRATGSRRRAMALAPRRRFVPFSAALPAAGLCALLLSGYVADGSETVTQVHCASSEGPFVIEVHPEWSPLGAARFLELVEDGFYTDSPLFRVAKNFLVQFGIGRTPEVTKKWRAKGKITDDPNIGIPVKRGTMAYAGGGKDSRTTQVWIAFKDSKHLGTAPWETPFGQVVEGMENVDKWYNGYDGKASAGKSPQQGRLMSEGNAYAKANFPDLSYILQCDIHSDYDRHSRTAVTPLDRAAQGSKISPHMQQILGRIQKTGSRASRRTRTM